MQTVGMSQVFTIQAPPAWKPSELTPTAPINPPQARPEDGSTYSSQTTQQNVLDKKDSLKAALGGPGANPEPAEMRFSF